MTFDFKDKCVLITGGSRGIGKACAQIFANAGAKVGITYLSNQAAAQETITTLAGIGHNAWQLEVQDAKAIEILIADFIAKYGRIDVLINNAGIYLEHKILEASYDEWQTNWKQTIDAN